MLSRYFTILFVLFYLILATSCNNTKNKLVRDQIDRALEVGENQPQLALKILHSIPLLENLDNDDFMLYQIADVRATRNANEDISRQQVKLITKAAKYFEKQNDVKNAALANYYTAVASQKTNDIKKGFTYYLKAYPYAQAINDSLLMGKTMYNLGIMYTEQKVYDSAYTCFKKAIPLLKNYPKFEIQAHRILALNFYLKGDYDNALKYLNDGFILLDKDNNCDLYNETYGIIYKSTQKYKEAAYYLRKNLTVENSIIEQLRASLNLTDIYTLARNTDSASYYMQVSVPLLNKLEIKTIDDYYLQLFGYKTLLNYSIELGSKDQIIEYVNLYLDKQKEIDNINTATKLLAIDKQISIRRIEEANKEAKARVLLYTFLISSSVFTVVLFIIVNRMKHRRTEGVNYRINRIKLMRS